MNIEDFKSIIKDIVTQAEKLMHKIIDESAPVNYACIFCQSDEEYSNFLTLAKHMGKMVQESSSGFLFQIEPLPTVAGNLQLLKIRHPDPTRPERGDADFTLSNYSEFKKTHLGQKGFSLIDKGHFEMIEYMDPAFNVRVYFSHPPLDQQLGIV